MRNYLAAILLLIGFFWHPAWLIAWVVGRSCSVCHLRKVCEKHRASAEILDFHKRPHL